MTRTAARELAIQLGFSVVAAGVEPGEALDDFFAPDHYASMEPEDILYTHRPGKQMDFIRRSVIGVSEKRAELDGFIARYAKGWRTERIDRAAAAILRQAMYELLYMPDIPAASSIDEAVELAKGYEDADVVAFINGVLGSFARSELPAAETGADEPATVPETPEAQETRDE